MLVQLRDEPKGAAGEEYHRLDPQVQLRMLTGRHPAQSEAGWYPFDGATGRVGQGCSKELRDAPQRLGGQQVVSGNDVYRWVDTAERLLSGSAHSPLPTRSRRCAWASVRLTATRTTGRC
jgi:hypothetical protein